MADEYNITAAHRWFIGADKALRFTIYDDAETVSSRAPVDITSYTLEFILRTKLDGGRLGNVVITKTSPSGGIALTTPLSGICTVTIEDGDTDGINPGTYEYSLRRTDAGAEDILAYGTAVLRRAAGPA